MNSKQRMSRRRMPAFGLALMVALAFGAVAANGAQALDWQHTNYSVLSGSSSETVAGTGSAFSIVSSVVGIPTEVNCSSATTSGSIVAGGTGSSAIGLGGCSVAKPSTCSLGSQPTLNANVELVQVGGTLFEKFVPSGTKFGSLEFTGANCPINGAVAGLKGSFAGRELSSTLAANHSLSFTESGPWPSVELLEGTKPATLTGEVTQHLSGAIANHGWRPLWQETHGGWEVESGSPFTKAESVSVSGGPVKFSFTMSGTSGSFSCSATSASAASLKPGGTETVEGLKFSGCKVESPASCTMPSSLTFETVTGTLMQVNGKVYEKFARSNPELALITLSFGGSGCPFTGTAIAIKGSFAALGPEFGLSSKVTQPLEFSKAANEATGSQLSIGMSLAGSIQQKSIIGETWGAF